MCIRDSGGTAAANNALCGGACIVAALAAAAKACTKAKACVNQVTKVAAKLGKKLDVDDLLKGAKKTVKQGSGKTTNYVKKGGYEKANSDFDALKPINVKTLQGGRRIGALKDGRTVVVRPNSSQKSGKTPTLDIAVSRMKCITLPFGLITSLLHLVP